MRRSRYRIFTSVPKIILHGLHLQRFPSPTSGFKVYATGKISETKCMHTTLYSCMDAQSNRATQYRRHIPILTSRRVPPLGVFGKYATQKTPTRQPCLITGHPQLVRFLSVSFAFCDSMFPYSLSIFFQHGKEKFMVDGLEYFKVTKQPISLPRSIRGCRLRCIHCHHKLPSEPKGRLGRRHVPLECAFLPKRA